MRHPNPDSIAVPVKRARGGVFAVGWLIAMNAFLLSPVLLYELGLSSVRGGGVDKIALFALPASVGWLLVVQLGRRPVVAHAMLFPFYWFVATDLYFIFHYETRLTSSTITLLLENWGSSGDYWKTHVRSLLFAGLPVAAFYAAGLYAIRGLEFRVPRLLRIAVPLGVLMLYGAVIAKQIRAQGLVPGLMDVVSHDRNSPFGVIPQGAVAYEVFRDVREHQRLAGSFRFGARRTEVPEQPELFVLVIGESARRDHWGLYGYARDTTPRLATEQNLVLFSDVVTQAALTQIAVPLILTRAAVDDHNERLAETSILSVFKEVGFSTAWYSTQQRDQYTGAINRYTDEADSARFLDRQYDGALVELFEKKVFDPSNKAQRQLFVLHTQGSHGDYLDRTPRQFERFPVGGELAGHQQMINAYDNSIAYTDQVLANVIAVLKNRPGITAMFYVPDHGENLGDDERGLQGHFFNNEYDLPIPMAFWYSEAFASRYPAKVAAVKTNSRRPISTRAIFFTLADLIGADFGDIHQQSLSVLSPAFTGAPRRVLSRWISVHDRESTDIDHPPEQALREVIHTRPATTR